MNHNKYTLNQTRPRVRNLPGYKYSPPLPSLPLCSFAPSSLPPSLPPLSDIPQTAMFSVVLRH